MCLGGVHSLCCASLSGTLPAGIPRASAAGPAGRARVRSGGEQTCRRSRLCLDAAESHRTRVSPHSPQGTAALPCMLGLRALHACHLTCFNLLWFTCVCGMCAHGWGVCVRVCVRASVRACASGPASHLCWRAGARVAHRAWNSILPAAGPALYPLCLFKEQRRRFLWEPVGLLWLRVGLLLSPFPNLPGLLAPETEEEASGNPGTLPRGRGRASRTRRVRNCLEGLPPVDLGRSKGQTDGRRRPLLLGPLKTVGGLMAEAWGPH